MWASVVTAGAAIAGMFGKMFGWLRQSDAKRAAKAEGQAEYMQETIEDVDDANKARRRLRDDPDYADELQRKYTRSDK